MRMENNLDYKKIGSIVVIVLIVISIGVWAIINKMRVSSKSDSDFVQKDGLTVDGDGTSQLIKPGENNQTVSPTSKQNATASHSSSNGYDQSKFSDEPNNSKSFGKYNLSADHTCNSNTTSYDNSYRNLSEKSSNALNTNSKSIKSYGLRSKFVPPPPQHKSFVFNQQTSNFEGFGLSSKPPAKRWGSNISYMDRQHNINNATVDFRSDTQNGFAAHDDDNLKPKHIYSEIEEFLKTDAVYKNQLSNKFVTIPKEFNVKDLKKDFSVFSILLMVCRDMFSVLETDNEFVKKKTERNTVSYNIYDGYRDTNIIVSIKNYLFDYDDSVTCGDEYDLKEIRNSFIEFASKTFDETQSDDQTLMSQSTSKSENMFINSSDTNSIVSYNKFNMSDRKTKECGPRTTIMSKRVLSNSVNNNFEYCRISLFKDLLNSIVNDYSDVNGFQNGNLSNLFPHYLDDDQNENEDNSNKSGQIVPYFDVDMTDDKLKCFGDILKSCFTTKDKEQNKDLTIEAIPKSLTIKSGSFVILVVNRSNISDREEVDYIMTDETTDAKKVIYMPFPVQSIYEKHHFVLQSALTMSRNQGKLKTELNKYDLHIVDGSNILTYFNKKMEDRGFGKTFGRIQHEGVILIYRTVDVIQD